MADPVTIQQLIDAGKDTDTIEQVTMNNGFVGDSTTNRDGVTIDTLEGRLKRLGYDVPITYAGGIVYAANDRTKTVDELGIIYAPLPSALPFTTSGTFVGDDDARFFPIQGAATGDIKKVSGVVYDNLADAIADADNLAQDGDSVYIRERIAGSGIGDGYWSVSSSGTADTYVVIARTGGGFLNFIEPDGSGTNLAALGILPGLPSDSIATTITRSAEIIAAITAYVAVFGDSTFKVNHDVRFDGKSLFDNIPQGCTLTGVVDDTGYSYTGYRSKGYIRASGDIEDIDSRDLVQSGHHPVVSLVNSQLPDTGNGGVGQSNSSLEGKCSITFQAGYQTFNGREIPAPSERLQRYQTNGVGPVHLAFQLHTLNGTGGPATRTIWDVDADGNASLGGFASREEYNLMVYPNNTYTPAGDKRTTLALRNVQPSGNGCRFEFVSRDVSATNSMAVDYLDGVLSFLPTDALEGGYLGRLEEAILSADLTVGEDRSTVFGVNACVKPVAAVNKGLISGINTLATGLTATQALIETKSVTHAFSYIKCRDETATDLFEVDGNGNVTATSYTPFTGVHLFFSPTDIAAGIPVDLIDATPVTYAQYDGDKKIADGKVSGTVGKCSTPMSKICTGVVQGSKEIESGYIIYVAAVGDNVSGELKGFNVNAEGGLVKAGDILCTSSTVGELMKMPEGSPESVVRFTAMSAPGEDGFVYGYF